MDYELDPDWCDAGRLLSPVWLDDIATDAVGNLYVQQCDSSLIRKLDSSGTCVAEWSCDMCPGEGSDFDTGVAVDASGSVVYAAGAVNVLHKLNAGGQVVREWAWTDLEDGWPNIGGMALGPNGTLYLADQGSHPGVKRLAQDGTYMGTWECLPTSDDSARWGPNDVAVSSDGYVYLVGTETARDADGLVRATNDSVRKYDSTGRLLCEWGSRGADEGQFHAPSGIAVDAHGDVYVVEYLGQRFQRFTAAGGFVGAWSVEESACSNPYRIAVDPDGNVYLTDPVSIMKMRPVSH